MGNVFGRKKYTNFFSYARSAVIVLGTISPLRRFTTTQFVRAFNALRISREPNYDPLGDKKFTAANDSLRTLVEIKVVERVRTGVYEFREVKTTDSRKFNKFYTVIKTPSRRDNEGKN